MRSIQRVVLFCMMVAGAIHLLIAPDHYVHAPAHGLIFAALGLAQLGYAGLWWHRFDPALRLPGLLLSGGVVVLWLLTHLVATPFATVPHPLDWAATATKLAEAGAFLALVGLDHAGAFAPPRGNPVALLVRSVMPCLGAGLLAWGGGLVLAPSLPQLAEAPGHSHDGHNHVHDDAAQAGYVLAPAQVEDTYAWNLPAGFPPPYVPPDNPMTLEKVALGRLLFYDKRLSVNGTMACASCHEQSRAFTDGKPIPHGATGELLTRNSQGLANVAYYSTLTWANPVLTDLERQILIPMFSEFPVELGITGHEAEVLARFQNNADYQALFAAAYPGESDPYTWGNIVKALASFNRALISADSPYDRYVAGDFSALSSAALRGMDMFLSEELECHHCHGGFNFTGSTRQRNTVFIETPFHNTGLYNLDGQGAYPANNTGVAAVSNRPEDMGRFRAPSLRNVALTAPYMHDGSVATLEEVVRLYEAGGRHILSGPYAGDGRHSPLKSGLVSGFTLTDQERADLLAFLEALTDQTFVNDPRFSDPFAEAPEPQASDLGR
ncbi:methanobactin export MATE transporter MbnM [Candidatus Chloroploca sp. Khr17]|uniref:methanobactin export MATE transporter MbnM n=1 Tax=Candidatus Chloroploca sp. Khr17 TaxID=2496869 RepID=UPI00196AE341|nr:methanobactin export MATE transporter MbnM [Candidatus Chloroploca sp. Khr17]